MKGKYKIIVSTKRLKYEFQVRRNLTIIRGDSATGKTTLIDMIRDYVNNSSASPVQLVCEKNCFVLEGVFWKSQLTEISDSIVFIDEGNSFIKTVEFAASIQNSNNYYVIVSREGIPTLPYSVEEIYGIRTSGKYGSLHQSYHEFYRIYNRNPSQMSEPELLLTEDSNSGYQFFDYICKENNMQCIAANGKSNLFHYLKIHKIEKVLAIADGAAFGSEIDKVLKLLTDMPNVTLYLPESFEWLILSSGVLKQNLVREILNEPSDYIESETYFSWERFFTAFLTELTNGTYMEYTKSSLNHAYLKDTVKNKILDQLKWISIRRKSD